MKGDRIFYRGGYKYQLCRTYRVQTGVRPTMLISTEYITLEVDGTLTVKQGYAWDGPSGPTIDTPTFMRGSLVHDALYQLMREKFLDHETHRKSVDLELIKICKEDGMCAPRRWWVRLGVRWFAEPASDPKNEKQMLTAP